MKNTGLVSIILLNYNGKQFNRNCIDSIFKQTYNNYEIIFVDNKSTDGSLEEIERCFKREIETGRIKIVKNSENMRFAGGNNSGVCKSSKNAEYIWLLNNDTVIESNCLEELIKGIQSDSLLGGVSSLILDKGIEDNIKYMMSLGKIRIVNVFGLEMWEDDRYNGEIGYTSFLCGCSFLYKKNIIEEPFFDFYKIYAEDTQLSRELLFKGYKLGICKKSIVYHFGGGTTKKIPYTKMYLNSRNLFIDYFAFLSKKTRIKLIIPFIVFHFLQTFSNIKNCMTILKAKIKAYFWVKKNKKYVSIVRNRINEGRNITEDEFLSLLSCKMACDDFHSGKVKLFLINILNFFNKIYYDIFFIHYRK